MLPDDAAELAVVEWDGDEADEGTASDDEADDEEDGEGAGVALEQPTT